MNEQVDDPVRGSSEPGRYWTTTNLSEATPDVLSPMCWSVWGHVGEIGWLASMKNFGVLPVSHMPNPDPNTRGSAVFYGRQALNVDAVRAIVARLPGISPDDFERDLMGSVRDETPHEPGAPGRLPIIMVKAPRALLTTGKRLRGEHDAVRTWWRREVYGVSNEGMSPSLPPLEALVDARDRFESIFSLHCTWRFVFQGAQSVITAAAEKAGDPRLATDVFSGLGDVHESKMADDLWRLAHKEIEESDFLAEYGFHGPNEGNVYTFAWREDPSPIHVLASGYARRDSSVMRPMEREAQAVRARAEAVDRLLAATPAARRPFMKWVFERTGNVVRTLQLGKAGYLMTIDGCRAAARRFGVDQVEAGTLQEVDDVFFLTIEECRALQAGDLPDVAVLVRRRREDRAEFKKLDVPVVFRGMPEPISVADEVADEAAAEDDTSVALSGAASGGGVVEGRARVVLDPAECVDLDDGDILVCRFTDPSWAPIMGLAEALVIDIGGSASHGAVVARELGIPYVIGTKNGTTAIKEGDRIVVDGERNQVSVVAAR